MSGPRIIHSVHAIEAEQAALDAVLRRIAHEIVAGLGDAYWRAIGEGVAASIVKADGSVETIEPNDFFSSGEK